MTDQNLTTQFPHINLFHFYIPVLSLCHSSGAVIGYFTARDCCVNKNNSAFYTLDGDSFDCIGKIYHNYS